MTQTRDRRAVVAYALYATILIEGLVLSSIGPTLDALGDQTGSTLSQISILFTANSLGYIVGSLAAGRAYSRLSGTAVLAAALVSMAALIVFVPVSGNLWLLIGLFALIGVAIGLIDVGCNTLLVWLYQSEVPPYMNTLHLAFGVGAVLSPLIIDRFAVVAGDATTAFWLFAAVMIPAAVWIYRTPSPSQPPETTPGDSSGVVRRHRWFLGLTAVFFFMHVGAELSFAGWIFSYAEELGKPETTARVLNSLFWGGLVVGRIIAIPLSRRLTPVRMLQLDLAGAVASIGLMALFPDWSLSIWIGTIGFGASVASMFATSINYAEQRMAITSHVTALFLVGGSAGSMSLPWLVGQYFESRGPESMVHVITAASLAAVALFLAMRAAAARDSSESTRVS